MAEQVQQTTVNSFVRGLLTEATPLTYPKDFSTDELNCELERTGLRRRREGIEFEDNNVLSSFTVNEGDLVHTESWKNAGNTSGTELLVLQVRDTLYFYDKSVETTSSGEKSFSIDLRDFDAGTEFSVDEERISATSIRGDLVVVSRAIEPFVIEFDSDADTISTSRVSPKVRDFDWQGDKEEYFKSVAVSSVTDERKYDTANTGWTAFPLFTSIDAYVTDENKWPSLNLPWWVATKPTSPDFDETLFDKQTFNKLDKGTTLIGNGRIILDLFKKDRSSAIADGDYGFTVNLPIETENTRFATVTSFAGRVWYSGLSSKENSSKVFFSRVVQTVKDIGEFYQQGDPTSEHDPDLVDSDGGVINIPEAGSIVALYAFGDVVLVFSNNGVWEIGGVDSVFKATEFFVRRVTGAEGLENRATLVDAQGTPFWWSDTAIYSITVEDVSQRTVGQDISKGTIQTFWEDIDRDKRLRAIGKYDPSDKRIYWLYEKDDETVNYKYNRILILDLQLQAFIPWEICDEVTGDVGDGTGVARADTDYIVNIDVFGGTKSVSESEDVIIEGTVAQPSFTNVEYLYALDGSSSSRTCDTNAKRDDSKNEFITNTVSNSNPGNDSSNTLFGKNTTFYDTGNDDDADRNVIEDTSCDDGENALNKFQLDSPEDWVIEIWAYLPSGIVVGTGAGSMPDAFFGKWDDTLANRTYWRFQVTQDDPLLNDDGLASNVVNFQFCTDSEDYNTRVNVVGPVMPRDEWVHLAVQKNGDDHTVFVNGEAGTTVSTTARIDDKVETSGDEQKIFIGCGDDAPNSGNYWRGNLAEARISFEAFYSQDGFTPPSEPFPRSAGGDTEEAGGTVEAGGEQVVISTTGSEAVSAGIKFLVRDGTESKLTVATTTNRNFLDWNSCCYESYADTIYEFNQDITTRKNNIYVTCYFEKTPSVDSSCFLESFWGTGTNVSSRQQVYRPRTLPGVSTSPFSSVITRNKIRGRGRALQLRFESECQKDFRLEGYEVINAKPK